MGVREGLKGRHTSVGISPTGKEDVGLKLAAGLPISSMQSLMIVKELMMIFFQNLIDRAFLDLFAF